MKDLVKLVLVLVLFSVIFFFLRLHGSYVHYYVATLVSDLGGLVYLYSTVGTIFAVFSGFIIVSEAGDWVKLTSAAKNEARELHEMWLWSRYASPETAATFTTLISEYTDEVITKEWPALEKGEELDVSSFLSRFHDSIFRITKEEAIIGGNLFSNFTSFLQYRADRVEYSYQPLPFILKFTVILINSLVVFLSFFIGVHNLWLDYVFMISIVALATVIVLVIDDLDNPLQNGNWQLTTESFEMVRTAIRAASNLPSVQ